LLSPGLIGIGTSRVESLPSYFRRLAQHNGVTLGMLVWGPHARAFAKMRPDFGVLGEKAWKLLSFGTISGSNFGLEFSDALTMMTGQSGLRMLCYNAWIEGFSTLRLTRPFQAWCSICIQDGNLPYTRAVWELSSYKVCCRHCKRLDDKCGNCGGPIRAIEPNGQFLWCRRCQVSVVGQNARPGDVATPSELSVANSLEQLVADGTGGNMSLSASGILFHLFGWARYHGVTSLRELSAFFALSKATLSGWRNATNAPSLQRLIELCETMGLSIYHVLSGGLTHKDSRAIQMGIDGRWVHRRLTEFERQRISRSLKEMLRRTPSLTLTEAAREIGVAVKTLKRLAPSSSAGILRASRKLKQDTAARSQSQFKSKIRKLILAGVKSGSIPSRIKLELNFAKPGWFREASRRDFVRSQLQTARLALIKCKKSACPRR